MRHGFELLYRMLENWTKRNEDGFHFLMKCDDTDFCFAVQLLIDELAAL